MPIMEPNNLCENKSMIEVKRINGDVIYINPEHIHSIEPKPDTMVTFTDGRTLLVKDSVEEVIERLLAYRRSCLPQEEDFSAPLEMN